MKFRRILAMLLCLCMASAWLPVSAAAEEAEIATIEEQIRAFADSIDQTDADDEAAWDLASHGMTKGGKKLSVGKSHALTAVLLNSELLQASLTKTCTAAIRGMQQLDLEKLENILGSCDWYGADSFFYMRVYDSTDAETRLLDWALTSSKNDSITRNAYDEALDWMVACTSVYMEISRTKRTADAATYQVRVTIKDRFDFAISGNAFFKDLISGIGALMFREFDWESIVTFEITAPYDCTHSTGAYHWTYDSDSQTITSDGTCGWQTNAVTRHMHEATDGKITYYYELENPVRLRHDRPWVMEYDVQNPGTFLLSPLHSMSTSQPYFLIYRAKYLAVSEYKRVKVSEELKSELGLSSVSQTIRHHHGLSLTDLFKYSSKKVYTFRLENQVNADGSNMIYLTIWDVETGEMLVDRIPMDDYYKYESWVKEYVLMDEEEDWLCGKDLNFSYIGNDTYRFSAEHFDLRVWENGKDGESVSYYEKTAVTAPTCTDRGYTTYTCSACAHSKKADYVADTGHSYTDVITAPTCTEKGYTTYTCANCGDSYVSDYTDTVAHSYEDGYCKWCGEEVDAVRWDIGTASLNGTIDLVMYVFLSEELVNDPETFARFTFENRVVDVPIAEAEKTVQEDGTIRCRFSCPLFAKQLADAVDVQIMHGETPVGRAVKFSVMQYCQTMLQYSDNPKLHDMCKAMLNYGAAAQQIFTYNEDNLANAILSEEEKELATPDLSAYKHSVSGSEAGIRPTIATLTLESEIRIRVYFKLDEGRSIDEYTFTVDGVEVQPGHNDNGWYIETTGIPAKRMEEMHEFKVGGLTVRYCALSYANQTISSAKPLEANMAKALYAYYAAAEAIFG